MTKIIASLLFLISTVAMAKHHACKADVEKFCKDIEHGQGRIVKCLKEHEAELSAECKTMREKMKQAMKEIKEACHDDVEKYCSDIQAGEGRIMKCIKEHKDQLSETCKTEIAEKKEMRKKAKTGK